MATGDVRIFVESVATEIVSGPSDWEQMVGSPEFLNLPAVFGTPTVTNITITLEQVVYLSTDGYTTPYSLSELPPGFVIASIPSQLSSIESDIHGNPGLINRTVTIGCVWSDWVWGGALSLADKVWDDERTPHFFDLIFTASGTSAGFTAADFLQLMGVGDLENTPKYIEGIWTSTDIVRVVNPIFNVAILYFSDSALVTWEIDDTATGASVGMTGFGSIITGTLGGWTISQQVSVPYIYAVDGVVTVPITAGYYEPFAIPNLGIYFSTPVIVEVVVPPIIETSLVIDLGLSSIIQTICDPAGIYTLVPGKTHDTLYERIAGTTTATSINVAIPTPFGITSYIPEQD